MQKIFLPLTLGPLTLKHRIIIPPMANRTAGLNGQVTSALLKHYDNLTNSGLASLIIVEHAYVNLNGKASLKSPQLSLGENADQAGLKTLVKLIKTNNCFVFAQLNHAGSSADVSLTALKGPSAIIHPNDTRLPQALTHQEIKAIINDFQASALLAYHLGFDGVEIHAAHGFLLNQFLSERTNQRTDEYGGNLINRQRFLTEVVLALKQVLPRDFPLLVRLTAEDFSLPGINFTDTIATAELLAKLKVTAIDISGSFYGYRHPNLPQVGYFQATTAAVKQVTDLPVILTGGIKDLATANELLSNKKADLIGIGRTILKNPDWIKKNLVFRNQD